IMKKKISWVLFLSLFGGMLVGSFPISAKEASGLPKAPIKLEYTIDEIGSGVADGVVTVTLPAGHGAEDIYLFWGDDNGKLPGYTAFSPFKVSGNIVTHRIRGDVVVPQGATRLLACTYSDADGMSENYASCTLPNGAAISDGLLGTLLFEFQSVSDIHITPTYEPRKHHSDHMRAMLTDIMEISPNSIGIMNNGDTVNNGLDTDYEEFLKVYEEFQGAPSIYSAIGNHELFRYGTPVPSDKFADSKTAFWTYLGDAVPADATFCGGSRFASLNYSFERNGCKFIFLGTDVSDQNNLTLNSTTLDWLESELEGAGKGNPIFIIMHQPMYGTLSGSFKDGYGVTKNTAEPLKALLAKYPEVIMFNGHTHRDMNQYGIHYSRDEKLPNIFGTSSVGYLAREYDTWSTTETYKGSEGYYVYVYEDKIFVRGRDFLTREWISSAQFIVDLSEDALEKTPEPEVEAPLYGSKSELYVNDRELGGTITCKLPVNNNATAIALFFSSADTGIIGSDPFATCEVNCKDNYFLCDISFAGVTVPYTADYILAYSYSDTLGWSADCDVIDLTTYTKGGGAPSAGSFTMNKYSFTEGESIIVTAHKNVGTSWIGFRNIASSSSSTLNYWRISDSGLETAVDLTKPNSVFKRTFTELTPGIYEIGWIAESGGGFKAGKTPENSTIFVIHPKDNASKSGAVKTNKLFYRLGEPIYVTATKGSESDWIGTQLSSVSSGSKLWYDLGVSGVNKAFDITKKSNFVGTGGEDYKYGKIEPGVYELAWVSASKTNFQTGKQAADTLEFTVVDMSEMISLGVPVGDGVTDPNLSVLNAALTEVAKLKQTDYTEESWQRLNNAVTAAMIVRDDAEHTQEEIDSAYEAILDAVAALVKAPKKPNSNSSDNVTEPSQTTSDSESDSNTADDNKSKSGCGSLLSRMPLCVLFACVPFAFKKKKSR
ncbi:MAG: metallophosphoesterase, partial [Clostridia bacterium]|nr:metallophosphoesterase [Clostridia bacterium]